MTKHIACKCGFYDRDRPHSQIGGGHCKHFSLGQYQARIERLPTYAERKAAVEQAPVELREQIIAHLRTVRALKGKAKND